MKIKSFLLAAVAAAGLTVSAESWIYSTPACETRNGAGYAVKVDGADAPVSEVRNSAMPVNIRWPGHQRELDQTEIDGMVRFAFSGKVTVAVTAPRDFKEVRVRPLARQIRPQVNGRVVTFELTRPGAYSVEFDGIHRNLHVFADPPAEYRVNKSADTIVFGPGEHDAGLIELKSGQSLFLDEGAVVFGRVYARDADHIRIFGRGILDMSRIKEQPKPIDPKLAEEQKRKHFAITNAKRWDAIRLEFCDDVAIDGITIRDSLCYNIRPIGCRNLDIGNVKIVGNWRYNSDGIDMHNCENVRVHDCFVRTFDDSICVKGFDYAMNEDDMLHDGYRHDVFTNAVIERCTVWCDWGRSLEFGAETRAREIADITWRDCDLLRSCHAACELQNCDYAYIHGVLFEDIRVDLEDRPQRSVYSASAKDFDPAAVGGQPCVFGSRIHVVAEYSKDGTRRGRNRDITLRNIRVTGKSFPIFRISGYDEDHRTTGVVVDGFYWNGREISSELDTPELCGPFAERPRFVRSGGSDAARNCSESMNGVPAESSSGEKGGVKVLVLGNSIALHEPRPQIGWTNEWGMAASAADRDFAHLFAAGIGRETGRKVDLHVKNIWLFEKDYWHYPFERELGELVRFAPDYLVIAVGENMADFASDDDRVTFRKRFGELLDAFGTGEKRPKTVVRGVFWTNAQKDAEMKAVSDERQVPFVALDICNQPGMKATGFFKHPGVAAHPSDQGMAEIARRLLDAMFGDGADKVRVACIGDSITWGYAMTNRVAECYPAQLQSLLGPNYDVRNFGDPGAGVYSHPKADPRGWTEHTWRTGKNGAAAYAFEPDIVVCNLGINDSGSYLYEFTYDERGRPKTEPGLFRREYGELLLAFGKGGKLPRIIMWTRLGPLGKSHPAKGSPNPFVMERDLRAVAEAVGAEQLDMYTPLLPYAETPDFADDGVHPEGGAQRVIAEITAKRIQGE